VAFALHGAGASAHDVGHTLTHFLTGADYRSSGVLALTSAGWFLLFAVGVGIALLLAHVRPRWGLAIAAAVVLLAAADSYHFAYGYNPMGPASKVIPPVTPAVAYLERHRGDGRIVGLNGTIPNDWPLTYGLADVRGYDPPQPTIRMLGLWRRITPQQPAWQPLMANGNGIDAPEVQVLGALGARYLVDEPGIDVPRLHGQLRVVYAGKDATVIASARVAPPALVPVDAIVTSSERATRDAIVEARFDPRTTVAIERDQPGVAALAGTAPQAAGDASPASARLPAVRGSVTIAREENASVTLHAALDRRGLVALNDDLTEGWSVRVDGRPAPALHVNDVMRGVLVPAGRHEIVWSYAVPGLRLGAWLSLLTLAVLCGSGVALGVRARHGKRRRDDRRTPASDARRILRVDRRRRSLEIGQLPSPFAETRQRRSFSCTSGAARRAP
jgi:hypothetical protein